MLLKKGRLRAEIKEDGTVQLWKKSEDPCGGSDEYIGLYGEAEISDLYVLASRIVMARMFDIVSDIREAVPGRHRYE